MTTSKPRIAVFAGATATILNTMPLVTSNKARLKYGLAPRTGPDGSTPRFDVLRPQRLAKAVTVLVEAYSAHPLEADSSTLYAEPDGYLDADGHLHRSRQNPADVPVLEVTLEPSDGLYPLPYMGRQANGNAWEGDGAHRGAQPDLTRQPFYPDASRLFEEIDRLGVGEEGLGNLLSSRADFDFFRVAPPGGYTRRDGSPGETPPPEVLGQDYFPYRPGHLRREPRLSVIAKVTNDVQRAMASGTYLGGIWLEGSPFVEETTYWLNLLIDTTAPIVGNASHRPHGAASNDGDRNVVDAVDYICSRIWSDRRGRNRPGVVMIQDEVIMTSREVQKADARPGGYLTTGGHGGVIGSMGQPGPALMTFLPVRRHTYSSDVATSKLPAAVRGVRRDASTGRVVPVDVAVKNAQGDLDPRSIPWVSIVKHARYSPPDGDPEPGEVEVESRIEANLGHSPLAGFVAEGAAPYGSMSASTLAALRRATLCGMPVVHVGRGNPGGFVPSERFDIAVGGSNLTATKARLLLMACLLRFGALPPVRDVEKPRPAELRAIRRQIERYQRVFDTH